MLEIKPTYKHDLTAEEIDAVYTIIINAYRVTEEEVWGKNYVRVSKDQFLKHIEDGEIFVAFMNGKIVGGVRVYHLREKTWTFSLLGADFKQAGKGIGRALIEAIEKHAIDNGGEFMHIEILRAENREVASKKILSDWYQRLGYDFIKTLDVFAVYNDPVKWSRLANPSVFDCYRKQLI